MPSPLESASDGSAPASTSTVLRRPSWSVSSSPSLTPLRSLSARVGAVRMRTSVRLSRPSPSESCGGVAWRRRDRGRSGAPRRRACRRRRCPCSGSRAARCAAGAVIERPPSSTVPPPRAADGDRQRCRRAAARGGRAATRRWPGRSAAKVLGVIARERALLGQVAAAGRSGCDRARCARSRRSRPAPGRAGRRASTTVAIMPAETMPAKRRSERRRVTRAREE